MVSGGELIDKEPPRHVIDLPEGSWGEGGYHTIWLNEGNHWTWEQLYPAQRRMRELAATCREGTALELATQAGRELLLAEASDWQFLISTLAARDYAEIRFADHIERFNRLANLAEAALRGHTLNAEETAFFRDCKQKDAPFADLDISSWSKLEHPLPTQAS